MATIGEKIKEARESTKKDGKKLSQAGLAEAIGLESYQIISRYENGSTAVTVETLKKIAKETNKPVSWFFDEEKSMPEIKTVADVIETVKRLGLAFQSNPNATPRVFYNNGVPTERYELIFQIPLSYHKVFEQLERLSKWSQEDMPIEARDAWEESIMRKAAQMSVDDMLKEGSE